MLLSRKLRLLLATIILAGGMQMHAVASDLDLVFQIDSVKGILTGNADHAVGEPVWIQINVSNRTSRATTIWMPGSKNHGFVIEVDTKDKDRVKSIEQAHQLEQSFQKLLIPANGFVTYDVLLNDFLRVLRTGDLHLICVMAARDEDRRALTLSTLFLVEFSCSLSDTERQNIASRLKNKLDSVAQKERLKIVRTAIALSSEYSVDLLIKATNDQDEYVQLEAVNGLSLLNSDKAIAALEQVLQKGSKAARRAAEVALRDSTRSKTSGKE